MIYNILGIWTISSFLFMWYNFGNKGLDYWRWPWYKKAFDYIMGTPLLVIVTIIMWIIDLIKWAKNR